MNVPLRVYTASSWRNARYPQVVADLRKAGHEVYDFRDPWDTGAAFDWSKVKDSVFPRLAAAGAQNDGAPGTPGSLVATPAEQKLMVSHPVARRGFASDKAGMEWADCCLLVTPCGSSAHMEAGWFAGVGKPVVVLLSEGRPELTYTLAAHLAEDVGDALWALERVRAARDGRWEAAGANPAEMLAVRSPGHSMGDWALWCPTCNPFCWASHKRASPPEPCGRPGCPVEMHLHGTPGLAP